MAARELTFEENAVVNYDWYHPQLASRHNVGVRGRFATSDLIMRHENVDEYGITMCGARRSHP